MMEKGVIATGAKLLDSNGQQWIVGSLIGLNGRVESYEAASCNDKAPTEFSVILQIVPQEEEPLPTGFKLYLDHAKPNDLDKWKRTKRLKHLGIPVLLGKGSYKVSDQNYKFIVIERHGKDLWSLFLDHDKKFQEHTAYKITLQIITALKYVHSKSYVHGDIRTSNIVVDVATQNYIYLMIGHSALYTVSDDQVDPNKTHNGAALLLSRDAHMGVLTERGDMEMLFYNLVQWLGIELPWAKNVENPSLILEEKNKAFTNVQSWSEEMALPAPVRQFMELLATMDTNDKPIYKNFILKLADGLRHLYTLPNGILEFSISRVPIVEQIAEDSDQANKPQRRCRKLTSNPKLGISVKKLAMMIAVNCRHEGEVRLWDTGPDSLIEIFSKLVGKRKSVWLSLQNKVANAWDQDTAELKTMTRRLWEEKALKAKRRTTNETALLEKEHERSDQKTPTVAVASTSASTSGLNHTDPNVSQSHPVAMSINETSPQENLASLDLPNISPPDVDHTLQDARSASPSRSNPIQSPLFQTSTSSHSSRSSSRVGFHAEDLPLCRTHDPFHETELSQPSKEIAIEAKEEAGINDETVTVCWRSESVDGNQWLNAYEWLNTWLEIKKPALNAFGPIPLEPRAVASQVQQVRVLLDDFRLRNPRIRQLMSVLAKLPPNSVDAHKLKRIQQRWQDQLDWLEKRGRELGESGLGQLRKALQDVSSNLDKLPDRDPEDHLLRKVETLAGQLEEQGTVLASAGAVIEQLCQAFSKPTKLRTELRSISDLYDDLHRRINVKKSEIGRSLKDGRQLDDSRTKIIVWLDKERDMYEKLIVSADRVKLLQQQQHYQCVMSKEAEVTELLKKSRDFLSKPQNRENLIQQSLHDLIKSQWDRLKKNILQISIRLQTCLEHCDKYHEQRNLFLKWLNKAEGEFRRFRRLQPASLDDTEAILKELSPLNGEVRKKSGEFEQVTSLGETFVSACDEDNNNTMKNELLDIKNRWDKLNTDLCECIESLKNIACRFAVFRKGLNKLERRVDELMSHNALRDETEDPNLTINSIKVLRAEADSLRRPLDDVREQANDLASKVGEQRIDAGRLTNLVELVAAKIDSLKTELLDRLNKAYELKLANIEDTKPIIPAHGQDMKPPILMSNVNQSCEELVDLVSDIKGEVDVETADVKPSLLLPLTNPLTEEMIDLVSSSDSDDDLLTPQQNRPGPRSKTRQNQFEKLFKNGEQGSKADNSEQNHGPSSPEETSWKETNDANNVSSDKENNEFTNSHNKRKRPLPIISDSDNSDSDDDHKKMMSENSRKRRK